MKEKLAGLALGTMLIANGCGGSGPNSSPDTTVSNPNATIEDLGELPHSVHELYKSTDKTTGQVCYIVANVGGSGGDAISCPVK